VKWLEAPAARLCHPREEHLLPLFVIAGAADDDSTFHANFTMVGDAGHKITSFRVDG
jgi:aromatic ring-opening dioxygenase catalytic subunit (LigB family)